MLKYITDEEYVSLLGAEGIPDNFENLAIKASNYINHQTYGRIDKNNIPSMPFPRRDLISLSRKIAAMPPEKRQKLPYLDQNMANSIAACAMIQRAIVDTCGMNEFRVSPNGLCMGVLKLLPTLLF